MTDTIDQPTPKMRAQMPGLGTDPASVRQRVEAMEKILERMFVIPGIRKNVGLDAIIGLVPVLGDIAATALGAYIVWEAKNLGMSRWQMTRLVGNVGVDWLIGLIPFVGDVTDVFFQSNSRNLKIIKRHLDKHHPATRTIDIEARRP